MATKGLSLTTKIFLSTAAVVAAVLGIALFVTQQQAERTAAKSVNRALSQVSDQIATQLDARRQSLQEKATIFAADPTFRAIIESKRLNDVLDRAVEAQERTGAGWVQITDAEGTRLAKSDDPGAAADDLSQSALISGALGGKPTEGYGKDSTHTVFQAIAVPIQGAGRLVGTLMAVKAVDTAFAAAMKATAPDTVDIAFFVLDGAGAPHVTVSTIGRAAELEAVIGAINWKSAGEQMTAEAKVGGIDYVARGGPLNSAAGTQVGGYIVLRDKASEYAAFTLLERTILIAGAAGLLVAGLAGFGVARQITRPVAQLVNATRKAADGDYSADITVKAGGEIGTLADAFRAMLGDLREKQALVEFLSTSGAGEAKTVKLATMAATMAQRIEQVGITPGTKFANRYEVKEVLGVGGMGMVFKAVDGELGELIAIKTLKQEMLGEDPSALERFKSEIRLARRISHRNVVRNYDLGEFGGVYYITMEYVEGKSLKDLIISRGKLPLPVTLSVAKQLCRALEVAHDEGVIHRDIKPQNMVVQADGVLKVMDFGIARLAKRKEGVTQAGMVVGTPEYMAPEQLMGEDIDQRADIYAAGCVIYECLTGRTPITADNQMTLIAKLLEETPIAPRVVSAEIPEVLSSLVMATLSKKPAGRPQTALELHDKLAAIG